ncbi:MFS transporter [Sphingomonas psychrotolerans]|uniref:MFS transporter n=1 Tax=Sphingomonas psychrotolerans TaxID=1327635 RepID=A0ABU3N8U4_9SPHN|nr:MFS transporter [Sphingomonas psychrotolerans]MDT8760691.1 MFS transporter [Sphingomonas psychrotolerans]
MKVDRTFALLFTVMLAIAAGNTALQSVLPALGRSLGAADSAVAAVFSVSALLWVIAAPFWANRSDRHGRRAMVLLGVAGFTLSLLLCGVFLALGINGVLGPLATFIAFIAARVIYGLFGSAAPPAVQAIVAGRTTREERTRALTLLASAFGLGTILGPALAPYLVLGHLWSGGPEIGLAGPAFVAAVAGGTIWLAVIRLLPRDEGAEHGAAASYPSIGGQATGATVTAATGATSEKIGYFDRRVRGWIISGLVVGHAQAMTGQAIGFLIIDRLAVAPVDALQPTGLVLMMGAGSSLLAQWGLIPLLDLKPRALVLAGAALGAAGCIATGSATSLYGIALGYALASLGIGLARPGFTAGASLAVGPDAQGSVAGKVTSINGAAFVLGPSIGVGLYELWRPLPYLTAAAALACLLVYAWLSLRPSDPGRGAFRGR